MVQMRRLRTILSSLTILCCLSMGAAVRFQFDARSNTGNAPRSVMENNISTLLTEINHASIAGTALNLSVLSSSQMESGAKERLQDLWRDAHFECNKETNISNCLNDFQGFQIRKIPVTVKPQDPSTYTDPLNRELVISLNKRGIITGVRFAWDLQEDVETMLTSTLVGGVSDTKQRREILKWVEDFRCYYNEKNIKALNQIYSDDALIITGSVVTNRKVYGDHNVHLKSDVIYTVQSKQEYIDKLTRIFKTRRVKVEFDHISVMSHGAKKGIYGVTLHQKWRAGSYYDEGWLFLLWDFNDPEKPQIHVRTWQPDQAVAKDGVFTLDDFFIP